MLFFFDSKGEENKTVFSVNLTRSQIFKKANWWGTTYQSVDDRYFGAIDSYLFDIYKEQSISIKLEKIGSDRIRISDQIYLKQKIFKADIERTTFRPISTLKIESAITDKFIKRHIEKISEDILHKHLKTNNSNLNYSILDLNSSDLDCFSKDNDQLICEQSFDFIIQLNDL